MVKICSSIFPAQNFSFCAQISSKWWPSQKLSIARWCTGVGLCVVQVWVPTEHVPLTRVSVVRSWKLRLCKNWFVQVLELLFLALHRHLKHWIWLPFAYSNMWLKFVLFLVFFGNLVHMMANQWDIWVFYLPYSYKTTMYI